MFILLIAITLILALILALPTIQHRAATEGFRRGLHDLYRDGNEYTYHFSR